MRQVIGTRIIGELRARMDKEAADKKCSLSELIRQKIIFTYEQEEKKNDYKFKKIEGYIKSLMNLLIMILLLWLKIFVKKSVEAWWRYLKSRGILDDYNKTGKLAI